MVSSPDKLFTYPRHIQKLFQSEVSGLLIQFDEAIQSRDQKAVVDVNHTLLGTMSYLDLPDFSQWALDAMSIGGSVCEADDWIKMETLLGKMTVRFKEIKEKLCD